MGCSKSSTLNYQRGGSGSVQLRNWPTGGLRPSAMIVAADPVLTPTIPPFGENQPVGPAGNAAKGHFIGENRRRGAEKPRNMGISVNSG
jgi:hypothetical protein